MPLLKDPSIRLERQNKSHKGDKKKANHYHGRSRVAVVAKWRHNGRHSNHSAHTIGHPRHRGGRKEAEAWPWLRNKFCKRTLLLCADHWSTTVHPFCNHGNASSFLLPHLSDKPPWWPLCNCSVLNTFNTSWRPWPEHPMYHLWTTKATIRPPLSLQQWPGQFYDHRREAQRSRALCKGVLLFFNDSVMVSAENIFSGQANHVHFFPFSAETFSIQKLLKWNF